MLAHRRCCEICSGRVSYTSCIYKCGGDDVKMDASNTHKVYRLGDVRGAGSIVEGAGGKGNRCLGINCRWMIRGEIFFGSRN